MNPTGKPDDSSPKKLLPFWPHYALSEFIAWYVILGILVTLSALFPAGLEDKANPLLTPEHVKPEWYFLSVYQFLKVASIFNFLGSEAPRLVGIFLPGVALALLFFLPFLDRSRKRPAHTRPVMLAVVVLVLLIIIALTVWGLTS
jgi:quinol-cytochrome oxidoreductase complex cytochrome b subunit